MLLVVVLAPIAWLIWTALGAKTFDGPTSPSGIVVQIKVSDAVQWNPGSDYYSDVDLHTTNWNRCQWVDTDGQDSLDKVKLMVSSMKWTDDSTLEFDCANGKSTRIQLKNDLWKIEEFRKERQPPPSECLLRCKGKVSKE